jgi:hypothetical protein
MAVCKVVARFKDGVVMKGHTGGFAPNKRDFHLELLSGEKITIETDKLKALFFVKDFAGDANRKDMYEDVIAGGGKKIQVKFKDGEEITGYSLGYAPDRLGFFIIPADTKNNNERIFVVNSSIEEITSPIK